MRRPNAVVRDLKRWGWSWSLPLRSESLRSLFLHLFLDDRVKSYFLPVMWPHRSTLWVLSAPRPPHAFSVNVVGYACDLGVSELSTLTSKQTACLGFARKSCLLTEQSALGFPGRLGGVTAHRGKEDIFVSPLLWRQSLILELNPLILPGNHVQGFYQCTWQIQRHPLSTLSRASYNQG